jgi:hypothetical protein
VSTVGYSRLDIADQWAFGDREGRASRSNCAFGSTMGRGDLNRRPPKHRSGIAGRSHQYLPSHRCTARWHAALRCRADHPHPAAQRQQDFLVHHNGDRVKQPVDQYDSGWAGAQAPPGRCRLVAPVRETARCNTCSASIGRGVGARNTTTPLTSRSLSPLVHARRQRRKDPLGRSLDPQRPP